MAQKNKYTRSKKSRKPAKKKNKFFRTVVALILIIMVIAEVGLYREKGKLEAQKVEIKKNISSEKDRSKELKKKQGYLESDEFAEKVAKEKFGLFYPDEYVLEEK